MSMARGSEPPTNRCIASTNSPDLLAASHDPAQAPARCADDQAGEAEIQPLIGEAAGQTGLPCRSDGTATPKYQPERSPVVVTTFTAYSLPIPARSTRLPVGMPR